MTAPRMRSEADGQSDGAAPSARMLGGSLGATEPDTDFPLFLEWVREDKFPLEKLVTNRYSLDQAEEARVALEEGQILGRAIIEV